MISRWRALGADLPYADLRRTRGVAMDGYFWRLADPASGRVLIALCGLCRDAHGTWANVALAAHPGGFLRCADVDRAGGETTRFAIVAGDGVLSADADRLDIDLGPDARLHVELGDRRDWAAPALGGVGAAHLVPGLGQYWHPHLLGARVSGRAVLGGETIDLAGFTAYAERNWGPGGFPPRWWWGQAFPDPDVCVAFAGGELRAGVARMTATGIVLRVGAEVIRLGNPVLAPVRSEVGEDRWRLCARGPRHALEIEGAAGPADVHVLPVPLPAERRSVPVAHQHLAARLRVVVRRRGRVLYAGESALAGLESGTLDEPAEPVAGSLPDRAGMGLSRPPVQP